MEHTLDCTEITYSLQKDGTYIGMYRDYLFLTEGWIWNKHWTVLSLLIPDRRIDMEHTLDCTEITYFLQMLSRIHYF